MGYTVNLVPACSLILSISKGPTMVGGAVLFSVLAKF
jgi:hypothetical protein